MTRETKIGLLVGLAFIIVIGILLSDHLTSTTEPPQARLTQAGSNVRQGVSVPGAPTANPPITTVEPAPVTPQQPIPTKDDLAPKPQPVQIVQIGPSAQQHQQQPPVSVGPGRASPQTPVQTPATLIAQQPATQNPAQPQEPPRVTLENPIVPQPPPVVESTPATPDDALAQTAKQIGEEIVHLTQPPPPAQNGQTGAAPVPAGGKAYKAQEGDTLSKMAGRFMGGNTKANRDAITKANPSLTKNPDIVVVGKTYIIPTSPAGAAAAPAVATEAPTTVTPSASPEYWYTVKENDTLRKIAVNQLGDEDAWAAIQDLNKTTLKGEDKTVVIPGMKLRLPAKPVASAG